MDDPFEILMAEHRLIERALDALEAGVEAGAAVDAAFFERGVAFLGEFGDACHDAKEEKRLFPLLEERGIVKEDGPIGVMLDEHHQARTHVETMRAQLAAGDLEALRQEAQAYCTLIRAHIRKEEEVLFPMGTSLLTGDERKEIARLLATVDAPAGDYARFRDLAEDLWRRVSTPA